MISEDFQDEPVQEIADTFEGLAEDTDELTIGASSQLFVQLRNVCIRHGIDNRDDRIDLICEGMAHFFNRRREQSVSDMRQTLEAMQL